MFFQPPEIQSTNSNVKSAGALKSARRKRRKLEQKYKSKTQLLKREKQRFANTMSSWAENFTMAATWQLKHQVAHWKSRARALEYENSILRNMLRQYYVTGKPSKVIDKAVTIGAESESDASEVTEDDYEEESNQEENEEKMEISEEFLDFLKSNASFRKMRQEREETRKFEDELPMRLLESCPDNPIDSKAEYERLYGDHWQRIAALEMSLQSQFISNCDRDKPILWPTIPLRL